MLPSPRPTDLRQHMSNRTGLALPEYRFDIVAIRIENERSVVTTRISAGAKSRLAIVLAAGR